MDLLSLADKLGLGVEQLIEFYTVRAWTEWLHVAICGIICLVLPNVATIIYKRYIRNKEHYDDTDLAWGLVAICGITGLVCCIAGLFELVGAIQATISPEAYAIDQILSNFK